MDGDREEEAADAGSGTAYLSHMDAHVAGACRPWISEEGKSEVKRLRSAERMLHLVWYLLTTPQQGLEVSPSSSKPEVKRSMLHQRLQQLLSRTQCL